MSFRAFFHISTLPWFRLPCSFSGPVRQELGNSFSDGMFEEWNTAYIHIYVLLNNARQGGGGTLTVFMCYARMNTGSSANGLKSKQYSSTVTQVFMPYRTLIT